jgi:glycine betaine/proline transport system substrate-binding protein
MRDKTSFIYRDRRSFLKLAAASAGLTSFIGLSGRMTEASVAFAKSSPPIRMGVVNLSFYRVVGGVLQNLLESLGYAIEITEGSHTEIYSVLGQGKLDMLVAVWLPNGHAPLFTKYGQQAIELGMLYDDARFFWGVPDYLPKTIRSIAHLTRPDIAQVMTKQIQGIGAGAGITRLSQEVMSRYSLEVAGYRLLTGSEQEWIQAFEQEVAKKRGVIIPLWQPQFLNRTYSIRRLDDPLAIFPKPDRCVLVVAKDFSARFPASLVDILRRLRLSVDAITEMDFLANVEKLSPREAAARWMAQNPNIVQSWLI